MEGFSYRSVDEPRMASLRQKLNRQTLVKYKEPEAREYFAEATGRDEPRLHRL